MAWPMTAIIKATDLVKRYGDFTAVDGITFEVRAGEVFGFLGPNGAGKTTTIKMIACVSPVTAGQLTVDGRDVGHDHRVIKSGIGVVPQDENLDEELNVLQNLLVYTRYFNLPRQEGLRRTTEALENVELSEWARAPIETLSGGMKRRLLIARALLNQPKVLILDEPTTGLDPHARRLVWQRLRVLKERGVTMLLSTHYMDEAAHLCDRLVIMDKGRILAEGSPQEVVRRHAPGEVTEVRLPPWDKEAVLQRLDGRASNVTDAGDALLFFGLQGTPADLGLDTASVEIIRRQPSLEDVFLLLTGKGSDWA